MTGKAGKTGIEKSGGKGYQKLVVWQNAYKLRKLIYQITARFPKSEMRRVSQMRDSARSIKQTIKKDTNADQWVNISNR